MQCALTLQKDIEQLKFKPLIVQQEYSHHLVDNAFHSLQFAASQYGIPHDAVPSEVLHRYKKGMYHYPTKGFFSAFGDTHKYSFLNAVLAQISCLSRAQSDCSIPMIKFPKGYLGISSNKIKAVEMTGLVLGCM